MSWTCTSCGCTDNSDDTLRCACGAMIETERTKEQKLGKRPFGFIILTAALFLFGAGGIFSALSYENHSYPMRLVDSISGITAFITAIAIFNVRSSWSLASFIAYSVMQVCIMLYWQLGPEQLYRTSISAFTAIFLFVLGFMILISVYIHRRFKSMEAEPNNSATDGRHG